LVGLSTRTFTGWLEVTGDGAAVYAPHTSKGFVAPPRKNLLLVSNGVLAKFGIWRAQRRGTAERLEQLAAERPAQHLARSQQACQSSQNDERTDPWQMRWGEAPRQGPEAHQILDKAHWTPCGRLAMSS
jgi:hypothetical protein